MKNEDNPQGSPENTNVQSLDIGGWADRGIQEQMAREEKYRKYVLQKPREMNVLRKSSKMEPVFNKLILRYW